MKTAIAAESSFIIAGMPVSFIASLASLAVVLGWAAWKLVEHRHSIKMIMGFCRRI
jgi:hypothetical protein